MHKILYIHGLGSSSESSTGKLLRILSNNEMVFYNPSFSVSPKKALDEINKFIKENEIDIVVGSSMGGFYALQSDCKYGIVINPALTPLIDIKEAIGYGEHDYTNGEGKYTIDDTFFNELEEIIRRNYKGENLNDWYREFDKKREFGGVFGGKDELFSHYEDFHSINSDLVVLFEDMHHRFEERYVFYFMMMLEALIEIKIKDENR